MPKVSIIIPVYNTEKYLKDCLNSVISQTLRDIEIICIDDGSTDNSLAILKEYSKLDSRIKVVSQNNQGAGIARNKGILKATGEYIMFIDSDDWIDLHTCENAYKKIKANNNDLLMFNILEYDEKRKKYYNCDWRLSPFEDHFDNPNIRLCDVKNFINSAYTVTQIYSRDFLNTNNIRFSNNKFAEDVIFYIKALLSAKTISILNEYLYFYRIHKESSSRNFFNNFYDVINVRLVCLEYIEQHENKDYFIDAFLIYSINSIMYWFNFAADSKYRNIKDFYNQLREFFILINNKYEIKNIKNYINYKKFKQICKQTWIKYYLIKSLEKLFSLKNSKDRKHKIITLFGIKLKIKRALIGKKYLNEKIINNRIVIDNFVGNGFGCNPKYIVNEIIKQKLPYELIWLDNGNKNHLYPSNIKKVDYYSKEAFKYLSSAKIIISNCRLNYFIENGFIKKPNQCYIQTWHGCLAFKKIEKDIEHNKVYKKYLKSAKTDSKYINYLISPSSFDLQLLKNNFYYKGDILNIGYPRNDIFFYNDKEKETIINKVHSSLKIPKNKKIILYCPTFRDDDNLQVYKLNVEKILTVAKHKFSEDFVFVIKLHPNIQYKAYELSLIFKNSINATNYNDIQELLLATDILITDYSSCIFDYSLEHKPAFVYASDIKEYSQERGFYLNIYEMPFPIAETEDELIDNIANFNYEKYKSNLSEFLEKRDSKDNGFVSKEIVEIIKKNIEGIHE